MQSPPGGSVERESDRRQEARFPRFSAREIDLRTHRRQGESRFLLDEDGPVWPGQRRRHARNRGRSSSERAAPGRVSETQTRPARWRPLGSREQQPGLLVDERARGCEQALSAGADAPAHKRHSRTGVRNGARRIRTGGRSGVAVGNQRQRAHFAAHGFEELLHAHPTAARAGAGSYNPVRWRRGDLGWSCGTGRNILRWEPMNSGIVGRDSELAVAQAFLDVRDGARGLLVEGEPGIGKTAVWGAVVEDAARLGYRVLRCVGGQAEARLSFVGLSDLLAEVGEEELRVLPVPQREALERALVRRGGDGRVGDAKAIAVGLRSLVVRLADTTPVLVAVDDVQWLDSATALTLEFLAGRVAQHAVGVLVTLRAPLTGRDPLGLERTMGGERVARVRLGPLSLGALRVLIERRLGYRYARPVLIRIGHVSGGNPLFALEIAQTLGPAPALRPGAPLPVPDSLRELVASRVAEVPAAGRRALFAAAALSRPSTALVEQAASASGLAVAEETGLLRLEGDRVVFVHPLYASAVYGSAASRRRRALHSRLAELVADTEERARHLALATIPPDEQIAAAVEGAAEHARLRGAWDAAGELLEQACAFTPLECPEVSAGRVVRAAECYIHAGDRPRARALLESVLAQAHSGPVCSNALRLLAEIRWEENGFADANRLLEEALGHAEDPLVRARIHLNLGYSCCRLGDFAAGDVHAERGLAEAVRCRDTALLAEALALRAIVDYLLGRGVDWCKIERSLELEDRERLLPLQMRPSMIAALLTLYVGRLADARAQLMEVHRAARDAGDESDVSFALLWLCQLETLSGAFAKAASLAEESIIEAGLTGSETNLAWALAQRAHVHAHRGEVAEARADAAEAAASCERLGLWLPILWVGAALGLLELSLGDADAAWRAVRPLTESLEERGIGEPDPHRFLPAALEALIGRGELDRAGRLLDSFEAQARELDRPWARLTGARCRGLLLAARGDLDGADVALQSAVGENARMEMPFEFARTLLVQGQVRRRRRQKRAARSSLEQALAIFDELGTPLWGGRVRAELARLGPHRARGELTPSEQRVVELAAEGRSNKQIAAELFLSLHTVELHLSHAYAKLNVHSRAELAHRFTTRT
jgi:DNA-binding CsgD family transcriptional regulator